VGKIGTRNSKTVVGIAANAKLWIQDMGYDQYRPATSGGKILVPIHVVLLQSFWLHSLQVANDCLSVKKK
jgi:hypothetical protein